MVDMNADPAELVKGNAPIGDEIVPYPGNPMGITVIEVKQAAIIDVGQLVDARQSNEPTNKPPIVDIPFHSEVGRPSSRMQRDNPAEQTARNPEHHHHTAP